RTTPLRSNPCARMARLPAREPAMDRGDQHGEHDRDRDGRHDMNLLPTSLPIASWRGWLTTTLVLTTTHHGTHRRAGRAAPRSDLDMTVDLPSTAGRSRSGARGIEPA